MTFLSALVLLIHPHADDTLYAPLFGFWKFCTETHTQ